MTISAAAVWCIIALALLGTEMILGTIYLLVTAAGGFAAALPAFLGFDLTVQLFTMGIVSAVGACLVYVLRRRIKKQYRENLNDLDQGQRVTVAEVNPDGSAQVMYRGSTWQAVGAHDPLTPGVWEIQRAAGPQLILEKKLY